MKNSHTAEPDSAKRQHYNWTDNYNMLFLLKITETKEGEPEKNYGYSQQKKMLALA